MAPGVPITPCLMTHIVSIRTRRILLAYIVSLFVCTLTAGPVLDRNAIVTSQSNVSAATHPSTIPHFVAPIGTDVPEPATYIVVGTVLIAFSVIVHVLRRRRLNEMDSVDAVAEKSAPSVSPES